MDTTKFYVMRQYSSNVTPSIVFETEIEQDALDYARIMSHKEPNYSWLVATVNVVLEIPEVK